MYECFECGERSVVWDADFDYSDYGFEEEGIVHECHCSKCGAKNIVLLSKRSKRK